MTITHTAPGARFIRALGEKDIDGARQLLDDGIVLTALLPAKTLDVTGLDDVMSTFCGFVVDDAIQSVEVLDDHDVAGRRSFAYRVHWSTTDHGPHLFEQQGFYDTNDGRITWLHLTCSGDQPIGLGT